MFSRAHHAWRMHPWLRQSENIKVMLPGFGTAAGIFGTYVFLEAFYDRAFATKPTQNLASAAPDEKTVAASMKASS